MVARRARTRRAFLQIPPFAVPAVPSTYLHDFKYEFLARPRFLRHALCVTRATSTPAVPPNAMIHIQKWPRHGRHGCF